MIGWIDKWLEALRLKESKEEGRRDNCKTQPYFVEKAIGGIENIGGIEKAIDGIELKSI